MHRLLEVLDFFPNMNITMGSFGAFQNLYHVTNGMESIQLMIESATPKIR